jgi:hypothetical protein
MDTNNLMLSFLFGIIGMGMFMYGKKQGRLVPLAAGALLMGIPYLITNVMLLLLVCSGLTVSPWLLREG